MTEVLRKKLENSIISLYNSDGTKIEFFDNIEIRCGISKYSSSHKETYYILVDDIEYHKNKNIYVEYQCECGKINKILLKKFLNKTSFKCRSCKEKDNIKRQHHSRVLRGLEDKKQNINTRIYDFEQETSEFKEKYFIKHLTIEEFDKVKKYIYSINDKIINENENVYFLPYEQSNNQTKYRQMVVINNEIIPFQKIKLQCPICGEIFSISRLMKERLENNNFLCKNCYLTNKTFVVKKYNNLTYQSQLELKFINLCEKLNIKIENGHKISYEYNNVKHTYLIDFYLPDLRKQIEIKGKHIWHQQQIANGKWEAKIQAASNYCDNNNMSYHILFEEDFDNFFNLEIYSLDNNDELLKLG